MTVKNNLDQNHKGFKNLYPREEIPKVTEETEDEEE